MPNELTVRAITAMPVSADRPAEPKAEPFPQPANPHQTEAHQTYINPTLRLDASLGLVVIEFHDDLGKLTSSIPSQRQIEAYRQHEQALPDQQPGKPHAPTSAAPTLPSHRHGTSEVRNAEGSATHKHPAAPVPHAAKT